MGNWLKGRTSHLCNQLQHMASVLNDAKNHYTQSNDAYYKAAQGVADPSGSTTFAGQGAEAFLMAVDSDISHTKSVLDGFGHVGSACDTLQSSIANSSSTYDGRMASIPYDPNVPHATFDKWRDALIDNLFTNADPGYMSDTLSEVLKRGSGFTVGPWATALSAGESMAANDAQDWINAHPVPVPVPGPTTGGTPTPSPGDESARRTRDNYMNALHELANAVISDIKTWADQLQNDYKTFQYTIQNSDNYLSARDLYDYIYGPTDGTQSTNSPVTITPYTTKDGKKGLLITISGTDIQHLTWNSSLLTALQTGEGLPTQYQTMIEGALQQYMNEHPDMQGSELTISGYSLGGMQAQLFASQLANGGYPELTQRYHLHVANVVTYGAPVMGPPATGVNYAMYDATYDPIPLLSYYENPQLTKLKPVLSSIYNDPVTTAQTLMNQGGDIYPTYLSLIHGDQLPWDQKLNTYIDPHHQYNIQALTDVGSNSVGSGDPSVSWSKHIWGPISIPWFSFDPGHTINFDNHLHYYQSDQLNASNTALNIDPTSLGPTEYFPLNR